MDPDYSGHLQMLYPDTQWDISRFTHGSINATHRAVRISGDAGLPSLVLKHASPYFEDDDTGQLQPFSIKRQEMEEAIMRIWDKGDLFKANPSDNLWRVPKFLHRSQGKEIDLLHTDKPEEVSVMLIEDLGNVRNLRDSILAWAELGPSATVNELVAKIGRNLGTTLAVIHSSQTVEAINSAGLQPVLSQRLTDDVIWFLAMELLPKYLASSPRASEYFAWLVEDVKNPQHKYPPCLMHGDFNYGNILIPTTALEESIAQPIVADWEFATSEGRGVNGDISEFLSIVHCRIIAGRGNKSRSSELFRVLCESFCHAYREKASLVCTMQADDLNSQLYRSALLLTGRDMLTFAKDACSDDPAYDEMIRVGVIGSMEIDEDKMYAALTAAMLATDVAEYLVQKGVPFRQTHDTAGAVVRAAKDRKISIAEPSLENLQIISPLFDKDMSQVFDFEKSVERRFAIGGTGQSAVLAQIESIQALIS